MAKIKEKLEIENGAPQKDTSREISLDGGKLVLNDNVFLAPMSAITDEPFRCFMKDLNAGIVVSELISCHGIVYEHDKTLKMMSFSKDREWPFGLQLFGEDAEPMAAAAKKAQDMGVQFVDINMGCPVKKVVKKGAGSALLKDPVSLAGFLKTIKAAIDIPLTIKIRTGWDSNSINAKEIVQLAADSGVALVAIHGRTRAQAYAGLADWDIIGDAAIDSPIPVIGNGDIVTAENGVSRIADYPVSGIMIGRGALKNPYIFSELKALREGRSIESVERDYPALIQDLHKRLERHYGEDRPRYVSILMRKYLAWYSAGFPGGSKFRGVVYQEPDLNELMKRAEDFFAKISWHHRQDISQFLMGGHG